MDYLKAKLNKERKIKIKNVIVEEFQVQSGLQKKLILQCEDSGVEYTISECLITDKDSIKKIGLWLDIDENDMINPKNRGIRRLLEFTDSETLSDLIGKEIPVMEYEKYLTLKLD